MRGVQALTWQAHCWPDRPKSPACNNWQSQHMLCSTTLLDFPVSCIDSTAMISNHLRRICMAETSNSAALDQPQLAPTQLDDHTTAAACQAIAGLTDPHVWCVSHRHHPIWIAQCRGYDRRSRPHTVAVLPASARGADGAGAGADAGTAAATAAAAAAANVLHTGLCWRHAAR
jgi:hypothetical protein